MGTLLKRTISGILLVAVVVGCLWTPWTLLALVCFLSVTLFHEFYRLAVDRRFRREMVCVSAASVVTLALLFCHLQGGWPLRFAVVGFLPVVAAYIFLLFDASGDHAFPSGVWFPLLYITLPLTAALLLAWPGGVFTWRLLLGIFVLAWFNDIGAYCVGMLLGQRPHSRKLFPSLSPKKSWVGVAGGTLFCFLAAWGYWALFGASVLPLAHWLALAGIVSVFGVFGDLFESLIKRHAGVKDSSSLIPGHGGLLDRFDDLLFILPLAALYLMLFSLL